MCSGTCYAETLCMQLVRWCVSLTSNAELGRHTFLIFFLSFMTGHISTRDTRSDPAWSSPSTRSDGKGHWGGGTKRKESRHQGNGLWACRTRGHKCRLCRNNEHMAHASAECQCGVMVFHVIQYVSIKLAGYKLVVWLNILVLWYTVQCWFLFGSDPFSKLELEFLFSAVASGFVPQCLLFCSCVSDGLAPGPGSTLASDILFFFLVLFCSASTCWLNCFSMV